MLIGIICSNQGHSAILGQYKMYVNICANADSRKLILKFFSKTEKNGTNANFDCKSVDDIFLISFIFFCNSTIRWEFFYPITEKQSLFQYMAIQCIWYVLTQFVNHLTCCLGQLFFFSSLFWFSFVFEVIYSEDLWEAFLETLARLVFFLV